MQDGSREARERERLSRWVHDHGRAVYGFLLAMLRDRCLADDLVQEVFYRAWRARRRYVESGSARGYLLRIADRLARDRLRRAHRELAVDDECWQRIEPADGDVEPWEALARLESRRQLAAALAALSAAQRRTLLLRYYGNLEFSQIARIMGCPLNTALSHAHRGLAVLRRLLVEKIT